MKNEGAYEVSLVKTDKLISDLCHTAAESICQALSATAEKI